MISWFESRVSKGIGVSHGWSRSEVKTLDFSVHEDSSIT